MWIAVPLFIMYISNSHYNDHRLAQLFAFLLAIYRLIAINSAVGNNMDLKTNQRQYQQIKANKWTWIKTFISTARVVGSELRLKCFNGAVPGLPRPATSVMLFIEAFLGQRVATTQHQNKLIWMTENLCWLKVCNALNTKAKSCYCEWVQTHRLTLGFLCAMCVGLCFLPGALIFPWRHAG